MSFPVRLRVLGGAILIALLVSGCSRQSHVIAHIIYGLVHLRHSGRMLIADLRPVKGDW